MLRKTFPESIRKLQSNIIEITIWHGYSPVILLHIFRITFYKNISTWLLLTDHLLKETCHLSTLYTGTWWLNKIMTKQTDHVIFFLPSVTVKITQSHKLACNYPAVVEFIIILQVFLVRTLFKSITFCIRIEKSGGLLYSRNGCRWLWQKLHHKALSWWRSIWKSVNRRTARPLKTGQLKIC